MTSMIPVVSIGLAALALVAPQAAQQSTPPPHSQHQAPQGHHVMGFDQHKATHHFFLYEDGGAIEVTVNDKADKANLDAIRSHLPHITKMFGQGDFEAPMLVHERKDVPGTKDLARLKDKLKYIYAETPSGGRVDVVTTDREALAAVHAFLKFQIEDHKTGDKTAVTKRK